MGKTAIVIGATGLVGKAVVDELAKCPDFERVVAVTRRPFKHPSEKVLNKVVDFNHLEKEASVFIGQCLFSCLGTTLKQAGSVEAQRNVDFGIQYKVAELAAKNGVEHYLLVSSAMANANSDNAYLKMKGALEQEVLKLPFARISLFQPTLLMGAHSQTRPAEKIAAMVFPILTYIPGLRRFRPIRGEQVALKMVQVSQRPGPPREKFTLDEVFPN